MKTVPTDFVHPQDELVNYVKNPLAKRELFAAMAMQGIISAHDISVNGIYHDINARVAVQAADALINELNKEK